MEVRCDEEEYYDGNFSKNMENWWRTIPVCGQEVMDYDICDFCHWQNTGIINSDGGPNKMTLSEAKEVYAKGLPIR